MSGVAVPPRKRRRPALSCVECRRRKIKCDRRTPCNHCVQLKITTCTYPDTHTNIASRLNVPRASPILVSVNNHQANPEVPRLTSPVSSAQFSESDPLSQSLPSLVDASHSERRPWGSTPVYTPDNSTSEENVQKLVNRSRNLEQVQSVQFPSTPSNKDTDEVMSILDVNISSFGGVMLQVGGNCIVSRSKVLRQGNSTAIQVRKCNSDKTQFFGRSHSMNTFNMFSRICRFEDKDGRLMTGVESLEVREVLGKCKEISKGAKPEPHSDFCSGLNFKDYIPQREVADKLVDLYLRTYESTYRVLHIPSFKQDYAEYWNDSASTNAPILVKMLLVMAIGTCFYQGQGEDELRIKAQQWVLSAESWTAATLGKKQLTISSIQIYCLLLLARQTNTLTVGCIWIRSGNLLRLAFSMGLHRDPRHFPKLSLFVAEMRRRLWATVIEMTVQTSMDAGMPPMITCCDFDTEPPLHIDDEDISECTTVIPTPKPNHVFTRTSIQIILLKSLRTRLEIVQFINGINSESSYDAVLRFGQDITKACNNANRLIHSYPTYLSRPTAFQTNLLDIFVRRFLLEVHRPFFVRSQSDPRYYFSRKVCLETALLIFLRSDDHPPQPTMDDYERLKRIGDGFFKPIFFHAITIITVELILQLEEDIASGLPPSAQTKLNREPLYRAVDEMGILLIDRIRMGENNCKGPVFFSAAAALIHALTSGIPPEEVIPEAAIRTARQCLEILRTRTEAASYESGVQRHVSGISGSVREPDYGFDLLMPDTNIDCAVPGGGFEMLDSWLFTGWDSS